MRIENYLNDGANWQARAILTYLQGIYYSILDSTYDTDTDSYKAYIEVGRFENCREQGYTFTIRYKWNQKNYSVFEHRNSDSIIILMNETHTINTPTLDEMWANKKNKWDYDKDFPYGKIIECGNFIADDMKNFIKKIDEKDSLV